MAGKPARGHGKNGSLERNRPLLLHKNDRRRWRRVVGGAYRCWEEDCSKKGIPPRSFTQGPGPGDAGELREVATRRRRWPNLGWMHANSDGSSRRRHSMQVPCLQATGSGPAVQRAGALSALAAHTAPARTWRAQCHFGAPDSVLATSFNSPRSPFRHFLIAGLRFKQPVACGKGVSGRSCRGGGP